MSKPYIYFSGYYFAKNLVSFVRKSHIFKTILGRVDINVKIKGSRIFVYLKSQEAKPVVEYIWNYCDFESTVTVDSEPSMRGELTISLHYEAKEIDNIILEAIWRGYKEHKGLRSIRDRWKEDIILYRVLGNSPKELITYPKKSISLIEIFKDRYKIEKDDKRVSTKWMFRNPEIEDMHRMYLKTHKFFAIEMNQLGHYELKGH